VAEPNDDLPAPVSLSLNASLAAPDSGIVLYTLREHRMLLDPVGAKGSLAASHPAVSSVLHRQGKAAAEKAIKAMINPHLVDA